MVRAAINGNLDDVPTKKEGFFGLNIPQSCPGVPAEILNPRETWPDKTAYDQQAQTLVRRFESNFEQFSGDVSKEIFEAGPTLAKLGLS